MSAPRGHSSPPALRNRRARNGFSMAEMLIVMAIMTVLAATLIVLVPGIRTSAMRKAAGADIQRISMVLIEFKEDMGFFPLKPYAPANPDAPAQGEYMDYVLFKSLTDKDYSPSGSGTAKGWGRARDDWEFLRGDSKTRQQIVDPWGVPYYYIPSTCYLLGVRINDSTDYTPLKDGTKALPNYFGTTSKIDDKRGPSVPSCYYPPDEYSKPGAGLSVFYNPTTFQLHSKGPDQKTDYYSDNDYATDPTSANRTIIDACDRGLDPDDINNFGGSNVSQ